VSETPPRPSERSEVSLGTIAREWARIGCTGFGGPPAHIALFRRLCVERRGWLTADEFEDGVAATNLLPGPSTTQLSILCAWRLRGRIGGVVGGLCFILPGLGLILLLAVVFLGGNPPRAVLGAAAGAGAAVPAVAVAAAVGLAPASWTRIGVRGGGHARWVAYALLGGTVAAAAGSELVLVLLACGLVEVAIRRAPRVDAGGPAAISLPPLAIAAGAVGGLGAVAWVAFKVGALSYGGGFVIVPLMQHDAVTVYRWMSGPQFLNAVALGQVTPGPVVQTVAAVGYAADGIAGGLLAAGMAFAPSFIFVLVGAPRFDRVRANPSIQAFLTGAGPAVIGAIAGSAIPLAAALGEPWQLALVAASGAWLLPLHRGVVPAIVGCGAIGAIAVLAGAPLGR